MGLLYGLFAAATVSSAPSDSMLAGSTRLSNNTTMYYRLFVPRNYSTSKRYPLVLCMHGIGERGSDNRVQVDRERMADQWMLDSVKNKYAPFVLYPQCPANGNWGNMTTGYADHAGVGAVKIIDSLIRVYPIDTTRLYMGGLSWGGVGTMAIMHSYPDKFAAAFPCAGVNGRNDGVTCAKTPSWTWHGSADAVVNVSGSRNFVAGIENAGNEVVRFVSSAYMRNPTGISVDSLRKAVAGGSLYLYSEVTGGAHNAGWFEAFASPLLVPWLMSKSKVHGQIIFTWPAPGPIAVGTAITGRQAIPAAQPTLRISNGIIRWNGVLDLPSTLVIFSARGSLVER
ncbi:MAG: hypothetical protein JXA71_05945, partial [Chitinispirillaceae bacterium]|nr:hypothetical protein [Chitinispirillaceae bacterium]